MTNLIPSVLQTLAGENFTVYAYFNDGSIRMYDAKPLLNKGGVFTVLADPRFFAERLTVMNNTVAWDVDGNRDESSCIDIDPFTVYENSMIVDDPLADMVGS